MRDRLARIAVERGALVGLIVLVVYLWLAPSHIVAADNAEFATLGELGGRAHPSGYPLYVLLLRATSWLPFDSAAHRASVVTALIAVAQVLVLHAACRAWGARAAAASFAVAVFAAAPIVLRVHTEADVFALNSLIGSLVLWLAAPAGPLRGPARCAALGLVAGLGMANNLTCVLLAPIGIGGLVRGVREGTARAGLLAAGGTLVAGLLPYAYLPLAPDAASWGPIHSFGDLVDMFLRKDYGFFSHVPSGGSIALSTSLGEHASLIGRTWLWVPALLGVGMLGYRCTRTEERWSWCLLAASWVLVGPWFASRLGVDPSGVGGYIGGRMQILSAVVLAIPIASGFELVADRVKPALKPALGAALAAGLVVALTIAALPRLSRVHSRVVEAGVQNMLVPLPQRAIVIVVSEDQCFGARYLQLVEGVRPDVTMVCWTLTLRDWYRDRLEAVGVRIPAQRGGPAPASLGESLLATGRPLLVDGAQATLISELPSYPFGVLHRVLPRGTAIPSLGAIVDETRAMFATFDFDYPHPARGDDFAAVAHLRYAGVWRQLASALDRAGDGAGAATARELAAQLAPTD